MRGPSLVIALARVLILLSLQALSDIHFLFVNRPLPVGHCPHMCHPLSFRILKVDFTWYYFAVEAFCELQNHYHLMYENRKKNF